MTGDPLGDVVTLSGARCEISTRFVASEPWALRYPAPREVKLMAVLKGACWLTAEPDETPRRVETGDILILSAARPFTLGSGPDLVARDALEIFTDLSAKEVRLGEREDLAMIGGHVSLNADRGWMLSEALPALLHIDGGAPQAQAIRFYLAQLAAEVGADRPGAALAAGQLAQLLFVEALRAHLATAEPLAPGWSRALADPRLAPALRAMHDAPERTWRVDELARIAALSRTGFAVRFRQAVGLAPLAYLTAWRMRLARQRLRETDAPVGALAIELGYASEAAFSTAFKRVTGLAPSRYRLQGEATPR